MTITTERPAGDIKAAGNPPAKPKGLLGFYRAHSTVLHTITTLILGCVIWQVVAANTSALVIVPLGEIGEAFRTWAGNGELWLDFRESLSGFAQGFLLAAVVGILIGVLMAVNKVAFDFLDPWMSALYSTPLIALAPLYILVFGIGMTARVAVVFTLAVFPIVLNTTAGIRTTDPNLIETARAFGANKFQRFVKILLPWSIPFMVTGLRLAVGRGLMGVVVAEFFGSTSGLGHRVFISSQNFDTAAVWMGVFVLAAIGVVFIRAMHILENKIAPWRENGKNGGKIL